MTRRLAVGIALAVGLVVADPSAASAHASLVATDPVAGSVLSASPTRITLTFSEAVDALPDSIRLLAADGSTVALGDVGHAGGDRTLTADVPEQLTDGTYVVGWRAVSADSHPISGAFIFSVGAPSATVPGLLELAGERQQRSGSELALGIGRWASLAGLVALWGALGALVLCAPDTLTERRTQWLFLAGGAVAVAGTLLMIAAQASTVGSGALSWQAWQDVVDTRSGRWWALRVPVLFAGIGLAMSAAARTHRWWRVVTATGFVVACAVYAAGGHGVSGSDRLLGFVATVVHVGAMALWLGGLVGVLVALRGATTWPALARFSVLALGAVITLAVTGTANAWRQLGTLSGVTDSTYGRWLIVKLVVVLLAVAVAWASRSILRRHQAGDDDPRLLPAIRRTVLVESLALLMVLAATAGLVNAVPPRALEARATSATTSANGYEVEVVLDPAVTGGTTLHVYVTPTDPAHPFPDAVEVEATLPAQDLGPIEIPAVQAGPGHVTTDTADFPVPGAWQVTVAARFGDFDQLVFTLPVVVR